MASKDANKTKVTNGEGKKETKEKRASAGADEESTKKLKQLEEQLAASIGFSFEDMMCVDEYDEEAEEEKEKRRKRSSDHRSSASSKHHQSSSSHRPSHTSSASHSSSKQPNKSHAPLKRPAAKKVTSQPKKPAAASSSSSSGEKKGTGKSKEVASKEKESKGSPLKLSKLVPGQVKVKPKASGDVKKENNGTVVKTEQSSGDGASQLVIKSEQRKSKSPRMVECKSEITTDVEGGVSASRKVEMKEEQKEEESSTTDVIDADLPAEADELDFNDVGGLEVKSETAPPSSSETTTESTEAASKATTTNAQNKEEAKADQEKNKRDAASQKSASDLQPKRTEPDPQIAAYVQSLIKLEFDVKKYTCFYCNPCYAFLTTTAQWEEHLSTPSHRTMVCRWRECLELFTESVHDGTSKLQTEIESYSDVVVGAHKVIEVRNAAGDAHTWICSMCVSVCPNVDQLLSHLSSFTHIDNFMERADPGLYRPPGRNDQVDKHRRLPSSDQKRSIIEEARQLMDRQGRGRLRIYTGSRFQEWPEEQVETAELEEQLVMDKMELLFAENHSADEFPLKYDIIPSRRSIANHDFDRMKGESGKSMIGMQYMLEIWAPSRRVTPVYYCILCDYLVTNWTVHCTILKHCVCYLIKHYNSVYECVLFESSAEEEFRRALTMARDKVLMLEGRSMRVEHVIQLQSKHDDVFVPINATIAKRIVTEAKLEVPDPVRAKKSTVVTKGPPTGNGQLTKGTKVSAVSKPRANDIRRSSKDARSLISKRPSTTSESRDPKRHRPDASRDVRKQSTDASGRSSHHRPPSPKHSSSRDKKTNEKGREGGEAKPRRSTTIDGSQQRRPSIKSTTATSAGKSVKPHHSRDHHDERSTRVLVKKASWSSADGGASGHKSQRSTKGTYASDHHRKGSSSQQSHGSHSDRHHSRHDDRSRPDVSSSSSPRKRHRPHLSAQNLADLEKLLASIGFTVRHRLTERDLDQLEEQFGPKAIDDLCTKVLGAPREDGGGQDRRFDERSSRMARVDHDPAVAQQLALLDMAAAAGQPSIDPNHFVPGMLMPGIIPGMMPIGAINPSAVSAMLGVLPVADHLRPPWPSNY